MDKLKFCGGLLVCVLAFSPVIVVIWKGLLKW